MEFDEFEQSNGGRGQQKPSTSFSSSTSCNSCVPDIADVPYYWKPNKELGPATELGDYDSAFQEYEDYMLYGPRWGRDTSKGILE